MSTASVRATSMARIGRSSLSSWIPAASSSTGETGGSASPPRATVRIASKSSCGRTLLCTMPSAPATIAGTVMEASAYAE